MSKKKENIIFIFIWPLEDENLALPIFHFSTSEERSILLHRMSFSFLMSTLFINLLI